MFPINRVGFITNRNNDDNTDGHNQNNFMGHVVVHDYVEGFEEIAAGLIRNNNEETTGPERDIGVADNLDNVDRVIRGMEEAEELAVIHANYVEAACAITIFFCRMIYCVSENIRKSRECKDEEVYIKVVEQRYKEK